MTPPPPSSSSSSSSSTSSSSSSPPSTPASSLAQPTVVPEGRLGNLTPEQTEKLRQFWLCLYDVFDGKTPFDQTVPSSSKGQTREQSVYRDTASAPGSSSHLAPPAAPVNKRASLWLGRSKAPQEVSSSIVHTMPRFTGRDMYLCFWRLVMMDHPDRLVLRYLRARKWSLDEALHMLLNTLKWRIEENLDELLELTDVELDAQCPKFIDLMNKGQAFYHGADSLDRPIFTVNTRLHHKSAQSIETCHRFTLYTMECNRLLLPEGVETATILYDLTNFGLDNMDWGFVRLATQCFESYYPETLGICIVHKAPFIFWGLWKMIQPLLDPVVASKYVFTRTNEELHKIIPREHLPIHPYGGLDDWRFKYIPAVPGENDAMHDQVNKRIHLDERHALENRFDSVTRKWTLTPNENLARERDLIAKQLREQYTRLYPYIRATTLYHRLGVIGDGKVKWTYNTSPKKKKY
ncbi:hypothetical protein BGZ94_002725 [Podila epigama]|nr:hypothetical protein BGZ94_002725 [Podila epigama]